MRTHARLFVTALAYCLLAGALAPSANAGIYTISSCHFRDGTPAPTDLWRVVAPQAGAQYDLSCTDGSGVGVRLARNRTYPRGYLTGLEMRVPTDLTISAAAVRDQRWSSGTADWSFYAGYWGSLPGDTTWTGIDVCGGAPGGCSGAVVDWHLVYRDHDFQSFGLGVWCSEYEPQPCPSTSVAATYATGIELTLMDDHAPYFTTRPTGSLLDPRSSARMRTLRYSVADRGSGVHSATLQVDGQTVEHASFKNLRATCAAPYGTAVPCPSQASGAFDIDTSTFSPGPHSGRLVVRDASDGAPLRYDFTFMAPGPPVRATSCAAGKTLAVELERNPVRYGARKLSFVVRGLANPDSDVVVMDERGGAFHMLGMAVREGNRYTAHVPIHAPKLLRVAAAIDGGAAYACSPPLALAVRAGLRLIITPRAVFNGQAIRFRGRLLGGAVAAGRIVEVQARVRGSRRDWTVVRSLRTTRTGRFRMRYTFRRTHQRVYFEFRAVRRSGDGFPYAFGASNRRVVLVRG